MLKILIVDDESLTREGIKSSLQWDELQIDTVLTAESGKEGLRLYQQYKPQIILTDVRMPQMSGVEMAEQIHAQSPDTAIIFMSGYSDKEYLMAAIRMKAISYVEKPLNLLEVEKAIREASTAYTKLSIARMKPLSATDEGGERLAGLLTHAIPNDPQSLTENVASLGFSFSSNCTFTSIVLKFPKNHLQEQEGGESPASLSIRNCSQEMDDYISPFGLKEIHTTKYDEYLVYLLYGNDKPSEETLLRIAHRMHYLFASLGDHFIAIGKPYTGLFHAYDSYASAVILIQSSFFYEKGSIIHEGLTGGTTQAPDTSKHYDEFRELLVNHDKEGTIAFLDQLLAGYRDSSALLPNQVKDDYYKLFMVVHSFHKDSAKESVSILDYIDRSHNLFELHAALRELCIEYFAAIETAAPENNTITMIKDFIRKEYKDPMLSVKDISDHVHRTASYVCTLYKNETGQTLNQYLTEYRVDKAKALLTDPTIKITDISARVGYADGNYFSKLFRKYVGLSPSEYREKMLS